MTNPIQSGAQFPPPNTPVIDANGNMTLDWNRFFVSMWRKLGGTSNQSLASVAQTANTALTTANLASSQAAAAVTVAGDAQTTADTALADASTAQSTADTVAAEALIKTKNLSDLSSVPTARTNLNLSTIPVTVTFDTVPGALVRFIPINRNVSIGLNFSGLVTYAGVAPTGNPVFTIQYIRGSITTTIGTIEFLATSNTVTVRSGTAVNLSVGDILAIVCPASPDATLAQVGLTFSFTLR